MQTYRLTLQPLTAFGTPLVGDTLFGQLCWTLRHLHGESRLNSLLTGYTTSVPFMVVSDALPSGHIPLPSLPSSYWQAGKEDDRKALKKKRWLALDNMTQPLAQWQQLAKAETATLAVTTQSQMHNTINRQTGTTGTGQFSPFSNLQRWYAAGALLDVYIVLDKLQLSLDELTHALTVIGETGYGRDASTGLGKFKLHSTAEKIEFIASPATKHWLTLAPSAPQSLMFDAQHSYYQVQTRFGRHGDAAALGANPYKRPLLMARTAAVFCATDNQSRQFIGQGIADVSYADNRAVHQGYAPVIPLLIERSA
jgi:CRISPR-associated protein Csm4